MTVRLIATDLDNTLLTSAKQVTERTFSAIHAAHSAGLVIVAATGRYLASLPQPLLAAEIDYGVISNGSLGYDFARREILFVELLDQATQALLVEVLSARFPGIIFGTGRGAGEIFYTDQSYIDMMLERERLHDRREFVFADVATIISEPTIKLIARHPSIHPDVLLSYLNNCGLGGFHASTSGAPFVEIAAAGVTKATGLARICEMLGIGQSEVIAVGDAKNDVEMLRWAGVGVAVENAVPEAGAAADFFIPPSDEDGLAQFIESLLGQLAS
ncbi:MAG: Cof-type HAD-IIB family hydrolase [Propionibacteriaceae bacterium]|jgi:Cof subfamily protein (haloacid dehalogenase superfamily)|nr:Cof-type HAD-IIB family hydrolase [Propionibacteriaceae bacterium]